MVVGHATSRVRSPVYCYLGSRAEFIYLILELHANFLCWFHLSSFMVCLHYNQTECDDLKCCKCVADRRAQFEKLEYTEEDYQEELEHIEQVHVLPSQRL
jgi:hypothetical protein